MTQEATTETELLYAWLLASTAASGVPLVVEDEPTLLDVARRLGD